MSGKISLLALILAAAALGLALYSPAGQQAAKTETAYERVMRTRTLRCGYAIWPVAEEMDPNTKQLKGVAPDFAAQLAAKLNLKIEWTAEVQWGQQVEALRGGRIDAICSTDGPWVYSEAGLVDYTEPMYYVPIYVYGRRGETRFKTFADADRPEVMFSTIDGDISLAAALEKFPHARRLEVPQTGDISLEMTNVVNGKADLLISDPLTLGPANGDAGKDLAPIFDRPIAVIAASFSVAKGEPELLQMLNQGFSLLQQLGTADAILDRCDPEHKYILRPAKSWRQPSAP